VKNKKIAKMTKKELIIIIRKLTKKAKQFESERDSLAILWFGVDNKDIFNVGAIERELYDFKLEVECAE
jgi:hypothetical protein